jgi:hypothetical protein
MTPPHPALFDVAAGRGLPTVTDPPELCRSAREHRMWGLVWTRVQGDPDHRTWWELAALDLAYDRWRSRLEAMLEHVAARLGDLGVEVATFKGITTEARWYARRGERPCSDVDLLISPRDWHRAREIVEALHPGHVLAPDVNRLVRKGLLQSIDLFVDGVSVDLHFDVLKVGVPAHQNELIFERTLAYGLASGQSVRVLDPEVALVHLLVHLNKDRFRCLLGYADVARVLSREELDWGFIERFARREGLHLPVHLALQVVVETLALNRPSRPRMTGLGPAVWHFLWRPAVRLQGDLGVIRFRHRQDVLPLFSVERWCEVLRFWVRRRVFPARVFLDEWYPDSTGPYLWRLLRGRTTHVARRQRSWVRRRLRS